MDPELDQVATEFGRLRGRLFGIAYRMLGSAVEAADVVQDVWLRWQGADRSGVLDATAFLVTTTTRAALNVLQSARSRRESYVGQWLPEPVATVGDPELGASRGEALELAVLLLLEKLGPAERAAYVLREAFEYEYVQIAEIIQLEEANVRQLVSRARKHLESERQAKVSRVEQERLLGAFLAAAQRGDAAGLEALLAADVISYSDGGGAARAARVPVLGRARVAQFVASFASHFWIDTTLDWTEVNGEPAVVVRRDGGVVAIASVVATAAGIERIFWLMNPAKLGAFQST